MKVIVDSNIQIRKVFETPMEVELTGPKVSLGDLFVKLSTLSKSIEFISGRELGKDVEKVLINGKENYFFDTNLNEGDKIVIIIDIAPLGGG